MECKFHNSITHIEIRTWVVFWASIFISVKSVYGAPNVLKGGVNLTGYKLIALSVLCLLALVWLLVGIQRVRLMRTS